MGKCRKVRYRTELAAKIALAGVNRRTADQERDYYFHKRCHAWHLTKMDQHRDR